jgi:transposase
LAVRDALVRTRTRYIAVIKAFIRREGLRLPSGEAAHTAAKVGRLELPDATARELAPLLALLEPLNAEIAAACHPTSEIPHF